MSKLSRTRISEQPLPLFTWAENPRHRPETIRRTLLGLRLQKRTGWSASRCEQYVSYRCPNAAEVM